LKKTVDLTTLTDKQAAVADVSGNGDISAYDASLILRYVVGLDSYFPVNKISQSNYTGLVSGISLNIPDVSVTDTDFFVVTVNASTLNGLSGADLKLNFDQTCLQLVGVRNLVSTMNMECNIDNTNGCLLAGLAAPVALNNGEEALLELTFKVQANQSVGTIIHVDKFMSNEQDLTSLAHDGCVTINRVTTSLSASNAGKTGMDPVYPNPCKGASSLVYHLSMTTAVTIDVFNLAGQKVSRLVETTNTPGTYTVSLTSKNRSLNPGIYFIRMETDDFSQTQRLQVSK
jgi:hypothetical protein